MLARESPCRSGHEPTFVAITMSSRLPRAASHSPMIVSDSPPELPGALHMYESAVSTKFPPAATYASRTANEVSRSADQPNTLPPRHSRVTSRSEPIFAMLATLRPRADTSAGALVSAHNSRLVQSGLAVLHDECPPGLDGGAGLLHEGHDAEVGGHLVLREPRAHVAATVVVEADV